MGKVRKSLRREPAVRVEAGEAHATRASVAPVEVHAQTAMGEEMLERAGRPWAQRPQPHALAQQAPEARGRGLAGQQVASGELPEAAEEPLRRPAHQQRAAPAHEQRGDRLDLAGCRTRPPHRQRLRRAAREGRAGAGDRTFGAARRPGRAERGAELHQRLVQVARAGSLREVAGLLPQPGLCGRPAQVLADAEQPGENPRDVPVDDRLRTVERDRGHRARRVAPDTRELAQRLRIVGKPPGVPGHDHARSPLQVSRARVVAETRPQTEQRVGLGAGEALDVGKARQEALVVRDHRVDAGLLEHRLGDPDRVGIARAPPRQIAPVRVVPREQALAQAEGQDAGGASFSSIFSRTHFSSHHSTGST
jgi:hypothetical protein